MNAPCHRFIARNRAPRVRIQYDVELYGAMKQVQIPFCIAVFADLTMKPDAPLPCIEDRRLVEIDVDNFSERMKSCKPRFAVALPNELAGDGRLPVDIIFEHMEDFLPGALARKIPAVATLLEERNLLAHLQIYMDGKSGAKTLVNRLFRERELLLALASSIPETRSDDEAGVDDGFRRAGIEPAEFRELIRKEFKPSTLRAAKEIEYGLIALGRVCTQQHNGDAAHEIPRLIAEFDAAIGNQINTVLHHPEFQRAESTWRGLHYLVSNTETDTTLKIRVLNISKKELAQTLKEYKGAAWEESPIFKKIYEQEYGQLGGEPYALIVGDYTFDHSPEDVETLGHLARLGAAACAPFIASADPAVFGLDSWRELPNPRELSKIFSTPDRMWWRSLRESDDSRYLVLTLPGVLARLPYGAKNIPVDEFPFEEQISTETVDHHVWMNAAYAMARNIARAFKQYGWCARIQSMETGGAVDQLPVYLAKGEHGEEVSLGPTQTVISDRRAKELADLGFAPLLQYKGSNIAVFDLAPTLQKPREFGDPDVTAAARISATLPIVLASGRFAHYIRCILRDRVGAWPHPEDAGRRLNLWLQDYVDETPEVSSEATRAQRPLAAAEIVVVEKEGEPGRSECRLFIRPQYQLPGLPVSVRLTIPMPK